MPVQIIGRADSSLSPTFSKWIRIFSYETPSELMDEPRESTRGWLSDQGTEIGIGDCPHEASIHALCQKLLDDTIDVRSAEHSSGSKKLKFGIRDRWSEESWREVLTVK